MHNIHAWLYDRYCEPVLCHMWDFPDGYGLRLAVEQEALLVRGEGSAVQREDAAAGLRLAWGTEAFSLELRLGLEIALGGRQEEILD